MYQNDIVEEEDIQAWHALPASRAEDHKSGIVAENMKKCWMIGSHMIQQLGDQETDSEEDEIDGDEAE